MTAKKTACGCGGPKPADPYQESLQVVWHDPTRYDPQRHGPEYLPRVKMATTLKKEARALAASLINPKVCTRVASSMKPLSSVLAVLRAAAMVHQTHHWQTSGAQYYGDHLLFERLYDESQPFIDQVAERAVGAGSVALVNSLDQAKVIYELIPLMCSGSDDPEEMVRDSLKTESLVVGVVDAAITMLEGTGSLSNGTDNLLQGVSDLHEGFVYLLKQRAQSPWSPKPYDYSR